MPTPDARIIGLDGLSRQAAPAMVRADLPFIRNPTLKYRESTVFNTTDVRRHFPSLHRTQGGRPVVYFDNPAATQVPQEVIDGFRNYFEQHNANTGGAFDTSRETDQLIEQARASMADLLGAASPGEISFGQNMTSLTFQVSRALGRVIQPGDEILLSRLDHDANVAPWLALVEQGAVIRWIDIDPLTATLDLESAAAALSDRTRLLAVGYASNAFGTINPVRRLTEMAHAYGAWVFIDAVHYAPHGPIDVQDLRCDLLVCSAYKFFGPHLGILYARRQVSEAFSVYNVQSASEVAPHKWETGTQSYESLSGLVGAIAYLRSLSSQTEGSGRDHLRSAMTAILQYERTLSERLLAGLTPLPGVHVYGITDPSQLDRRVPTVSFVIRGKDPALAASELADAGIFTWAGNHYAAEPLHRLGLPATQRIGLVHYNEMHEIDRFLEALTRVASSAIHPQPPAMVR